MFKQTYTYHDWLLDGNVWEQIHNFEGLLSQPSTGSPRKKPLLLFQLTIKTTKKIKKKIHHNLGIVHKFKKWILLFYNWIYFKQMVTERKGERQSSYSIEILFSWKTMNTVIILAFLNMEGFLKNIHTVVPCIIACSFGLWEPTENQTLLRLSYPAYVTKIYHMQECLIKK